MKAFFKKIKGYAEYWMARCEPNGMRIRSKLEKKEDVFRNGKWLRLQVEMNERLQQAFPNRIARTNLKVWNIRPVDTWKREQEIEELLDQFPFRFESLLAIMNPYGLTPLSCLILFETEKECRVRYTVKGKTAACDFTYTGERFTSRHRVPVFGLYAEYENRVVLELLDEKDEVTARRELIVQVGAVSESISTVVEAVRKNEDTAMPFVFVTGGYTASTYAFDCNGDLRYLLSRKPKQYGVYPLSNGRFLFTDRNINRPTYYNSHALVLYDMDYLGRTRETYYVKEGMHHWAAELPGTDGNMVLGSTSSLEEMLMESSMLAYDRSSGETVRMYNLAHYFPKEFQDKYDWAHLNRVYCQDERMLILSLRNISTVVKFDIKEEKIIWLLSHPDVYKGTELEDKVLRPIGEHFHYFLQQHAAEIVDTGDEDAGNEDVFDLMLFDNHCNTKRNETWFDGRTDSFACFYRIDEKNFTAETLKAIPCAMSPTRSNVWYDKEKRRVFGMAGAASSTGEGKKALIYEWDFDTEEEVCRYEVLDGYFKAYPFDVSGGGLEECLHINETYRKGHLEPPVKCAKLPSGRKRLSLRMLKEMDFCIMDDLVCVRAMDHKVEKIYFEGAETWERDFADTDQKNEKIFASKIFYVAATTETLPSGRYKVLVRYDGKIYGTGKYFMKS